MKSRVIVLLIAMACSSAGSTCGYSAEDWLQHKYDCRHSGNVPERSVTTPLELVGTVPLTDAIFSSPVVADGHVYVVDGAGTICCIDAHTLEVVWTCTTGEGKANDNNASTPAIAGDYLHVGTKAGVHYVLNRASGDVVKKIYCGDPIFSAPVVANDRVYLATLGSRIYALQPDGSICWQWDYLAERMGFEGNRWNSDDWQRYTTRRASEQETASASGRNASVQKDDQFFCSSNLAVYDNLLVVPAGGRVIWLEDAGESASYRGEQSGRGGATLGLSVGEQGKVYRQWHILDNTGQVDVLRLEEDTIAAGNVKGTQTDARCYDKLSFSSVSIRGEDVYRCRPQESYGLCKHTADGQVMPLCDVASVASPILLRDHAVYGGLDGSLYVVSLSDSSKVWSFKTAFGKAITAPVAVADGRIYFGCEDGYLYVLGPKGNASLPSTELPLWKIRKPLTNKYAGPEYDWFTSFGNFANTDVARAQGLEPPFKINWIHRYQGTVKHFSTCGGGRVYTHTAEGQVFACEQETGRLLWRNYYPGVAVSYTSPLYYDGRVIVPQAGFEKCRVRCLDAETGKLIWEAPFSGSASWNRQQPPVVYQNLVIYQFSTGQRASSADEAGTRFRWLGGEQNVPNFPDDHEPLVVAWDLHTGKEVWRRNFSELGSGGDQAGLCLMDGTLYYSCYFGFGAQRRGLPAPMGVTAALDPLTGRDIWLTTDYFVHGGCTISGENGRLYLGGYNPVMKPMPPFQNRHGIRTTTDGSNKRVFTRVWCLNARDGSLVWESDPLLASIHVVAVAEAFLFTHAQYQRGYLLDKRTGKVITDRISEHNKCTRFTLCEPYLVGANLLTYDLSQPDDIQLVTTGPRAEPSECVGGLISNGRILYTTAGSGIQISRVCGEEAESFHVPWENRIQGSLE